MSLPLDEDVRKATFGLRPIRQLQLLCQIEVLQGLHQKSKALEKDYFAKFVEEGLSYQQKDYEKRVDVRNINLEASIDKIETVIRQKSEEEAKKELKGRIKKASSELPRREGLRSSSRQACCPYQPLKFTERIRKVQREKKLEHFPKFFSNYPRCNDFILYKKCKLMHQINLLRHYLSSTLNRSVMNGLLDVWQNIVQYFNKNEISFVILQSILLTSNTYQVNFAPLKLIKLMSSRRSHSHHFNRPFHNPEHMVTRTESTLIYMALTNGINLTQIKMANCACDSFIKVIVEHCPSLKYLDISDSHVSDDGLCEIAGLTVVINRATRLPRKCKTQTAVKNDFSGTEELTKTKRGLPFLTHLIANNLLNISWPPKYGSKKTTTYSYTDYVTQGIGCPKDSGFVLILKHLPNLKVFMTEISGRAIDAFSRDQLGRKKKNVLLPNMEKISEKHMTRNMMEACLNTCPNLKSVFVRAASHGRDEEWMEPLNKMENKLNDICVMDSQFRGPNLTRYVLEPKRGAFMNNLDMRGLGYLKLSWFQVIKLNLPNLQSLTLGVQTRNLQLAIQMIDIEKDFNFGNGEGKKDPNLVHLQRFHLIGPFGPDVTGYLIKGANQLKNLALTIDWYEPGVCSVQPSSPKDYLGIDYFNELKTFNSLKSVSELHLASPTRKGRFRLDKNFATYILQNYGKTLKHLGNFQYWGFSRKDGRWDLAQDMIKNNLDLTFDEHLQQQQNEFKEAEETNFHKCYVDGRSCLSCCDPRNSISPKHIESQNHLLSDFFEVLAGLQGFFNDMGGGDVDSDSDDSMMDEDMEDEEDDDVPGDAFLFFAADLN